ncbi:MAG TPA: acyltransferase family protein [Phenylobacterium sp.]
MDDRAGPVGGHRRDIDGLRAVAVLAIVAYHAFPAWVPGGFIGVDVFFVISGFLITRILAGERDEGRFSFTRFYLRRARRIVPAYVAVTLAVSLIAAWVMLPLWLLRYGGSLIASSLFLTNMWFTQGFGYFWPGAQQNPLLHLWSMGVEEQFYLIWPLLFAALSWAPLRRARPWLVVGLLAVSLAAAQALTVSNEAVWSFFLFPTRAWEFLAGGVLALGLAPPLRHALAANAAVVAGLALILASVLLISDATPFPGLAAVPPCLGAALILWAGQSAPTRAGTILLTSRPMVGAGLISYSLYLWHWPLLVLARIYAQGPLAPAAVMIVVAVSFGLAILSWRFVEEPFRRPRTPARKRDLALALSPLLLLLGLGALFLITRGLPMRLSPAARQAAAFADWNPARDRCFANAGPVPSGCRFGAAADAKDYDVLVWGDSHADAVTPGVIAWAQARGWSVREATRGGCPPLIDVLTVAPKRGPLPGCRASGPVLLREIADNPKLRLIVLPARWPMYAQPHVVYDPDSPPIRLQDARSPAARPYPLNQALDRTLDAIAATGTHARVVIVGPVPELTFNPPDCIAQARHLGRKEWSCWDAPARLPLVRARKAEAEIALALRRHPDVGVAWPTRRLCTDTSCIAVIGRKLIYADDDHLSATGARMLVPAWLDGALSPPAPAPAPPSDVPRPPPG